MEDFYIYKQKHFTQRKTSICSRTSHLILEQQVMPTAESIDTEAYPDIVIFPRGSNSLLKLRSTIVWPLPHSFHQKL